RADRSPGSLPRRLVRPPPGPARRRPGMSTDPSATPPAEDHASTPKDVLTLVLVCILVGVIAAGLMGVAPGLGIVLLILLAPILVRVATGPPQADPSKPRTGAQKAMGFFGSLGVLIAIGLASFAAFYGTCFVVCLGGLAVH